MNNLDGSFADTLKKMFDAKYQLEFGGIEYSEIFNCAYDKINIPLFRVCGHGISSSIELALLKIKEQNENDVG